MCSDAPQHPLYDTLTSTHKQTLQYVGGLEVDVDDETLTNAFIAFGELNSVLIPRDDITGKHRGFGFVEFEEADDAKSAIDNMNDSGN